MSIKRTKNIQMNRFILNAAVLTVAMASIISCRKTAAAPQFTLTNHTDTIAARGGTKTISFTTNKAWRIDTTGLEWLKISPVSGMRGCNGTNNSYRCQCYRRFPFKAGLYKLR